MNTIDKFFPFNGSLRNETGIKTNQAVFTLVGSNFSFRQGGNKCSPRQKDLALSNKGTNLLPEKR